MRQQMKRCAAALAAALCMTVAGCGKQQAEINPADAVQQLKDSMSFTDQMIDMDSAGACRFYDVDTELVQDSAAYVGSGATAESLAVFEATDADAAQSIADALQTFTDSWIKGYSDYKPEECLSWKAQCSSRTVSMLCSALQRTMPRRKQPYRTC